MLLEKLKSTIHRVEIDTEGIFKYIQILIEPADTDDPNTGSESYLIIRGWRDCAYHADVLDKFQIEEMSKDKDLNSNYTSQCPGGGRINHDAENKQIVIYGYSQGFGRADHEVTHKFIQDAFPDYEVAWNNEGY